MSTQILVIAKAPVPGRVKTRLCPPCTPEQAATLAGAALADTLAVVDRVPAARRTLVLDGRLAVPPGWRVVPQRGAGLDERLAAAYADTAAPHTGSLLVGMDTPQVTPALLAAAAHRLDSGAVDAVLGPAEDGGWWCLGLRDPRHGAALLGVPMSTPDTGARTAAALRGGAGLRLVLLPTLRDVDEVDDAYAVARQCPPGSRFARAVAATLPAVVR